jgi:hypothetical protein
MLRVLSLAAVLVAVSAMSATAQITSVPVVTSWPTEVRLMAFPLPAPPPVAINACAPPVVTFCNPCAAGGVAPTTTMYAPVTTYYVPTTTYYAPTTAFRLPLIAPLWRPATTTYYAPSVAYYSPVTSYRMPAPPEISVYDAPVSATPIVTNYAPTVSASPVMSAPVATGRSCGCGAR